jgi:hypothetical protein
MKNETLRGASMPEPILPDDFARRVITRARFERRRQLVRRRMIAAAAVVAVALPLARPWNLITSRAQRSREVPITQAGEEARTEQFTDAVAQAATPDQIGDYLMPNTAPLRTLAAAYSDASWNYDPSWTTDR